MAENGSNHNGDAPTDIRVSMTLPGSASLGAFQAGAVSALSVVSNTLRRCGHNVSYDALGGSSAGSVVALLLAHCLLTGRDAPSIIRQAWVDDVDVDLLRESDRSGPLGFSSLVESFRRLLDDESAHPRNVNEPLESPIIFQVGLTSLLGLTVDVDDGEATVPTLSYADWAEFELRPGHPVDDLVTPDGGSVLDAVVASASHPGAFDPRVVDRSRHREVFENKGVTNFPDSGRLWYTDGGLVESQPVTRVLAAARRQSGASNGRRVHIVVDPRSSGASGNDSWADDREPKSWLDGLLRSLSILPTQALHDDLRHVAEVNDRLDQLENLVAEFADRFDDPDFDPSEFRARIAEIAGLVDKEPVTIEMISPLLLADEDRGVSDLLAGDFVGAFGGFLNRSVRASDFRLGWSCVEVWLQQGLDRYGVSDEVVRSAVADLRAHPACPESEDGLDGDGVGQLDLRGRWRLARLAVSAGGRLFSESLPSPTTATDLLRRLPVRRNDRASNAD